MKTQYYTATSLDGFIADTDNSIDWLLQFAMTDDYPDFIAAVGAVAMGSTTYEWLLEHHMRLDSDDPQRWPYEQPAWIFSSRDHRRVEGNIHYVSGDVRPAHREMVEAAAGRNIWIVGGGDLAGQFHDHGLLDELIITIAPVTLGGGAPLLPRRIVSPSLRLVSVRQIGETFAQLRYEVRRD